MPDDMINVDPKERLEFSKKLVNYETYLKAAVVRIKTRLETASGHLQDPGSVHYIAEGMNLVAELEALLDGGMTQIGTEQAVKAKKQIELMESFGAGVDK